MPSILNQVNKLLGCSENERELQDAVGGGTEQQCGYEKRQL